MLALNPGQLIQLKNSEANAGNAKVKKVLKTVIQITYAAANYSIPRNALFMNVHGQVCVPKESLKALANRKITIPKRKR